MSKKTRGDSYIAASEEYISRIRSKYHMMSVSERQVADYFLNNRIEPSDELNIKDLARLAGTSVATIVRFCKMLGFKGFSELKYSIQNGVMATIGGDFRIEANDGMGAMKQKVAEFVKRNINASIQHTDNRELERAIEALAACKRILICSTGIGSGVALSIANTFMFVGIPCLAPLDALTMLRTASFCTKDDVVIGISNCGYIKDVVDSLKVAKDRGATTISVTGVEDSLITKYSDIVLGCRFRDSSLALDIVTVSICHMLTLQVVQIGYMIRHAEGSTRPISHMESFSEMARYALDLDHVENKRVRF